MKLEVDIMYDNECHDITVKMLAAVTRTYTIPYGRAHRDRNIVEVCLQYVKPGTS